MRFRVVLYRSSLKAREVETFLDSLNIKQRAKVLRQIIYLDEFGLTSANPSLKKLTNTTLWEIRILGKDNIRLICAEIRKVIYVLHIFFKKKQKTPLKELKVSLKRYKDILDI